MKEAKFAIDEPVNFSDGFGRNYEAKIAMVLYDGGIGQYHYKFTDIVPVNHSPMWNSVPKTTTKDSILEVQIKKIETKEETK